MTESVFDSSLSFMPSGQTRSAELPWLLILAEGRRSKLARDLLRSSSRPPDAVYLD